MTFNCFRLCSKKKRKLLTEEVVVYANDPEANARFHYKKNEIQTTKYTVLTFLPKNLFEQFRRLPNFYFLIAALVCALNYVIPGISPIDPLSSILPFVLIIATAAVKEGYEDFRRWQSDNELNNRQYEKIEGTTLVQTLNKNIRVGDILVLKEDQEVPADCVLLATSHEDGLCFVETANLDGESNLKQFRAFEGTKNFSQDNMINLQAVVRCEQPHQKLYEFKGNIVIGSKDKVVGNPLGTEDDELTPLGDKQLLMRGVTIRNTKWAYSLVVYTGKKTKLALNQVAPPSKMSFTEKKVNQFAIVIFIFNIATLVIGTIVSAVIEEGSDLWYAPLSSTLAWDAGLVFMAYFILFTYFIPLSLFVNLEIIKLIHGAFMMVDDDMKKDKAGMRVKNSNLNDELSRVCYIFSDKTGTLTENKMVFDQCTIDGVKYPKAGKGGLKSESKKVHEFFMHMALNHEVIPEDRGEDMPHFAAPTPDEIALVKGAFINGYQLIERTSKALKLKLPNGSVQEYELLESLEFSSERKRSSVILRTPEGNIIMYTKGADSVIKMRLSPKVSSKAVKILDDDLEKYSVQGLRTLVFAKKELTKDEYLTFKKDFKAASAAIEDRKNLMEKVMDKMEQDLQLQGCTAILDRLQDGVPHTIHYLIQAGIKVWMITGDKQETAQNIGYSCKLLSRDVQLVKVVKAKDSAHCRKMFDKALKTLKNGRKTSLVIDGQSMNFAFLSDLETYFLEVGKQCETVICCRAEPLQKALVVRMIKSGTKLVTLSIGDGANDVSMLQEAHIGVGIRGEEGTQAERASDYAIQRFKHLSKLVTIHGRYNMIRTAMMVEFSFYKNLSMFTAQFWYGIYCRYSAQSFFDDWTMAAYNTLLLALPPLAMAIFEKDLHEKVIFKFPEVYKEMQTGIYLNNRTFTMWLCSAFYQSLVFFFSIFLLPDAVRTSGLTSGLWGLSTMVAAAGIVTIILRGALATKHWVWINHLFYWGSVVFLFVFLFVESHWPGFFPKFEGVMDFVSASGYFWFYFFWIIVICLVPDVIFLFVQRQSYPYMWQIVQEKEALHPSGDQLLEMSVMSSKMDLAAPPEQSETNSSTEQDEKHKKQYEQDKHESEKSKEKHKSEKNKDKHKSEKSKESETQDDSTDSEKSRNSEKIESGKSTESDRNKENEKQDHSTDSAKSGSSPHHTLLQEDTTDSQ